MFGNPENGLVCVRCFYEGPAAPESEEVNRRAIRNHGLEVWPESHRSGFALCQADVLQSYMAQYCIYYVATRSVSSIIDGKKTTAWEESGFPARFLGWLAIFGGFLGLMGLLAILIALAAAPWWGLAPTVLAVAFLATAAAWCGYRFGADSRRPSGPISQRH